MPVSLYDSALYSKRFPSGDMARLFSDTAIVRAAMLVIGTLAKISGSRDEIPQLAAGAIHRASMELQIDPAGLAEGTSTDGTFVPALIESFSSLMQAPEFTPYVGQGLSAKEIEATARNLRLRQAFDMIHSALGNAGTEQRKDTICHVVSSDAALGQEMGQALNLSAGSYNENDAARAALQECIDLIGSLTLTTDDAKDQADLTIAVSKTALSLDRTSVYDHTVPLVMTALATLVVQK